MSDISAYQGTTAAPYEPGFGDYVQLLKPRVMSLVVFTALVGLLVAPVSLHPVEAFAAILFVALGAGASGALNMWWDADIDAVMKRTAKRPVPAGKIPAGEALAVGLGEVDGQTKVDVLRRDHGRVAVLRRVRDVHGRVFGERLHDRVADEVSEAHLAAARARQVVVDDHPVVHEQLGGDCAHRGGGGHLEAGFHVGDHAG